MKKYIANKQFYKNVLILVLPIVIQSLFVAISGYIDSLMINSYNGNSLAYNGVSAANRLMFIINSTFNGLGAVASVFIAQFIGAENKKSVQESFRFSLLVAVILGFIATIVIILFGNNVVDSFIQNSESRKYGYDYLSYIKYSIIIIGINMVFASLFRNIKRPNIPLIAGIAGILCNIFLNYCLIFGNLGFPKLGASGAAMGTLASKIVEFIILLIVFLNTKDDIVKGTFKSLRISKRLSLDYIKKGIPLILNEIMWASGMILTAKFLTYHNDFWYNAYSYSQNITDLFYVIFQGLATGVAVFIGTTLGESNFDKAKRELYWFKGLGFVLGVVVAIIMMLLSPLIILLFKPDYEMKILVIKLLAVTAIFLVLYCICAINFFTLRAGGDTIRAFIVDQGPTYIIGLPILIVLGINASKWNLDIITIFVIFHIADIIKYFLGNYFLSKNKWLKNITTNY